MIFHVSQFKILFIYISILVLSLSISKAEEEDLYEILGVSRGTSPRDIKKAYKNLAKEWHPDKRQGDPTANKKFMKINEAYETLSDPEKKAEYDRFGRTSAQSRHHAEDGFEQFFNGGFHFHFQDGMDNKYRQTLRSWEKQVLPESHTKPYVIYAYSDFCFYCMQIEPIWDKFTADLNTIGVGIGTINTGLDRNLASKIGIRNLPSIFVVINRKIIHYTEGHYSLSSLRQFLRGVWDQDLMTSVTNDNYKEFLSGWHDNRVRALFFGSKSKPTLRIVVSAFALRDRIAVGYINTLADNTNEVLDKFNVKKTAETLLIFHEVATPVAMISMNQLTRQSIDEVLESNKYLILPRLSSSKIFKELCPVVRNKSSRRLCILLLTKSDEIHDRHRNMFRQFAISNAQDRVTFAYMYEDKQTNFIHRLTKGGQHSESEITLKVAILWRPSEYRMNYDWLQEGWNIDSIDRSKEGLNKTIEKVLHGKSDLTLMAEWTDLIDEHQLGLITRILVRLWDYSDNIYHNIMSYDALTLISVAISIVMIITAGYFIPSVLNEPEPEKKEKPKWRPPMPSKPSQPVQFSELRFETFDELVIESPKGKLTLVILVNEEAREKLLQRYAEIVHPYMRSKYFSFAFLQMETYSFWYEHLLEETLGYTRSIKINPSNCVGTVLALNGYRKYYCMYHAHHSEGKRKKRHLGENVDFMGFDSSSSSEDQGDDASDREHVILDGDLLNGLPNWIDRLMEGSLKRVRIENWPEMATL